MRFWLSVFRFCVEAPKLTEEQKIDAELPKLRETLFSKKAHLIIWLKKLFLAQVMFFSF